MLAINTTNKLPPMHCNALNAMPWHCLLHLLRAPQSSCSLQFTAAAAHHCSKHHPPAAQPYILLQCTAKYCCAFFHIFFTIWFTLKKLPFELCASAICCSALPGRHCSCTAALFASAPFSLLCTSHLRRTPLSFLIIMMKIKVWIMMSPIPILCPK